jgi:hypothetical protein
MSRSYSRFPLRIICGPDSLNRWKRWGNRSLRRQVRAHLSIAWADPDLVLPTVDEVMNSWDGPRDGWGRYAPYAVGNFTAFEHYRLTRMK